MALTDFQRHVCRILAGQRLASGESYVAGGNALNEALASSRVSRDIDLFHDTASALEASWTRDRAVLTGEGLSVRVLRERPALVEAEVAHHDDSVVVEWTRDSAFRFFPLVQHEAPVSRCTRSIWRHQQRRHAKQYEHPAAQTPRTLLGLRHLREYPHLQVRRSC